MNVNNNNNNKVELVDELHRDARRNFVRRKVCMVGISDTVQADLVEMQPYARCRGNAHMRYILVAINIFSKKAYARPLKTKSAEHVEVALRSILDELGHPIRYLHVDMGKEFYNKRVQRLLRERNINMYSTYSTKKASIVERFNRTLKGKMWRRFSLNGSYRWVPLLTELIAEYNNTKHRTIKMRPSEVGAHNEKLLRDTVYTYRHNIRPANATAKFRVGDLVRLSKYKHAFEKGYTPNWTAEVFRVDRVVHTPPVITYRLTALNGSPIHGTVYAEELQLANQPDLYLVERVVRRQGSRALVKWLGFGQDHNSWVDSASLI